jgi:hypothetical protein
MSFRSHRSLKELLDLKKLGIETISLPSGKIYESNGITMIAQAELYYNEHLQPGHVNELKFSSPLSVIIKMHYNPKKPTVKIADNIKKKLKFFIKNNNIIRFAYYPQEFLEEVPSGHYDKKGAINTYVFIHIFPVLSKIPAHYKIKIIEMVNPQKPKICYISPKDKLNKKIVAILSHNLCPCTWCYSLKASVLDTLASYS